MTPENRVICTRCGNQCVPDPTASTSPLRCSECQSSSDTAAVRVRKTQDESSVATEDRTVFPSEFGVPIYAGKTVERHPDPQATTSININRTKAASKSVVAILKKGDKLGRFEIRMTLGHGSFGVVYLAYDPILEREVAIKVPRFVSDEKQAPRFLHEAKAPAKLRHPNIVAVFESDSDNEQPFIVGEYVSGTPLSVKLREGRLDFVTAVNWILQIAEALDYAHSEGVVHRDVKPSNVMITDNGRPQLMDFGLAIRVDVEGNSEGEGVIVGTPAYMAPEQARGGLQSIGPLSDQYSLGAMFYEMLTGQTPYQGKLWTVIKQVADPVIEPTLISIIAPDVPADLEAACMKAMSKQPDQRYLNLSAFAEDMQHFLKGEPLIARPIGSIERVWRWCRRNTVSATLLAVIAVAIVAFAIFRGHQAKVFKGLADDAKQQAAAAIAARTDAIKAKTQAEQAFAQAEAARKLTAKAKLETERMLIGSYHEAGLNADRDRDLRTALLWFGTAVGISGNARDLQELGQRRFSSWSEQVALPIHAHRAKGGWNRSLTFHPKLPYLMVVSMQRECEIWDVTKDTQIELPIGGPIDAAAWDATGARLALSVGSTVSVFEFPTWRELDSWDTDKPVMKLAFAPQTDWLAASTHSGITVRDCQQRTERIENIALPAKLHDFIWSPEGKSLATLGEDQFARVFEIKDGSNEAQLALPPMPAKTMIFQSIAFLSRSRLLLLEGENTLKCWDLETKQPKWNWSGSRVLSLAVSNRRDQVAVGEDFDVVLLDAENGQRTKTPRIKHRNVVYNVSFSPNDEILVSGGGDQTETVSEVASGQKIVPNIPHTAIVHRSCWSQDGTIFATVEWSDPIVRVWKNSLFTRRGYAIATHAKQSFLKVDSTETQAIPAGFDSIRDRREITPFSIATGEPTGATYSVNGVICDASFVTSRDALIAIGTAEQLSHIASENTSQVKGFVRLVDRKTGSLLLDEVKTPSLPIAVETTRDGKTAIVLCQNGELLLFETESLKLVAEHQVLHGKPQQHGFMIRHRLRLSPRGECFAVWGTGAETEIRDTRTGALISAVSQGRDYFHNVVFSPNGLSFVTCGTDGVVRQWKINDGSSAGPELKQSGWILTGQYSDSGLQFIAASTDRYARVWDLEKGTIIAATREHENEIYSIAVAPNQMAFLTGSKDGTIRTWDINNGGQIAPDIQLPSQIYQMLIPESGSLMLATGYFDHVRGMPIGSWTRSSKELQDPKFMKSLGELASGQRVRAGGIPVSLDGDEWLECWSHIRHRSIAEEKLSR